MKCNTFKKIKRVIISFGETSQKSLILFTFFQFNFLAAQNTFSVNHKTEISYTNLLLFLILIVSFSILFLYFITNKLTRKALEKQNKKQMRNEIYLKTILDTCSDAILVHDANTGKILDVNQAMLNMYGYEKKRSIKTVIKRY